MCTRWGSDPHSRMSYTYIPVGAAADDCEELRKPLASQLFWAGEATSRLFYGTVHGAYGTGLQAAAEVAHEAEAAAAIAVARAPAEGAASAPHFPAPLSVPSDPPHSILSHAQVSAANHSVIHNTNSAARSGSPKHPLLRSPSRSSDTGCGIGLSSTSAGRLVPAPDAPLPHPAVIPAPLDHCAPAMVPQQRQAEGHIPTASLRLETAQQLHRSYSCAPVPTQASAGAQQETLHGLSLQPAAGHDRPHGMTSCGMDTRVALAGIKAWTAAPQPSAMHAWSVDSVTARSAGRRSIVARLPVEAAAALPADLGRLRADNTALSPRLCAGAEGPSLVSSGAQHPEAAGRMLPVALQPSHGHIEQQQQRAAGDDYLSGQPRQLLLGHAEVTAPRHTGPWGWRAKPAQRTGKSCMAAAAADSAGAVCSLHGPSAGRVVDQELAHFMLARSHAVGRSHALAAVSRL